MDLYHDGSTILYTLGMKNICVWLQKFWSFFIYASQILLFLQLCKIFYATYADKIRISWGTERNFNQLTSLICQILLISTKHLQRQTASS
jgi:hypothetical protein